MRTVISRYYCIIMLCVFAERCWNILQSDLHISPINFCLIICRINIAQIVAWKVQTITHIFYHLLLKVMFHGKICKIDNCNLQNVSVRFFFSCEVLTSYLAICKSIKSMEGWCSLVVHNSSFWVMGPYFYVAMTLLTQETFFFHLLEAFLVLLSIDTKVLRAKLYLRLILCSMFSSSVLKNALRKIELN